MNYLIEALADAIQEEATMDADDRREGYADGLANHYQPKRSPIYDQAWYEAHEDAKRLAPPRVGRSFWQRARARIARAFA